MMTRTGRRFSILFAAIAALAKTGSAARREFLRSARVLAAVACLALVAALALPATTQAQSAGVLVSNIEQTSAGFVLTNDDFLRAQAFSVPSGDDSTLTSIDILFIDSYISASEINSLSVSVWSADASGHPLSSLHTLTNPASIEVDGAASVSFTAPADATLQAGTTYVLLMHFNFDIVLREAPGWSFTNSGDEDATSVTGWTIADLGLWRLATDTSWSDAESAYQLRVNGTAVGDTPTCTLNTGDIWCGVVTPALFSSGGIDIAYGFIDADSIGTLPNPGFSVVTDGVTNSYTIDSVVVGVGSNGGFSFRLTSALTAAEQAKLVLHVDDSSDPFPFSVSGNPYVWSVTDLDWSSGDPVTLRLRETAAATPPDAPTDFTATVGDAQVALGWDPPGLDSGVTGHEFRYETDGDYPEDWTAIANSAPGEANENAFTVTGLTNEVAHTFELRAVSAGGGAAGHGGAGDADARHLRPHAADPGRDPGRALGRG